MPEPQINDFGSSEQPLSWESSPILLGLERAFSFASRLSLVPFLFRTRRDLNSEADSPTFVSSTRKRLRQIEFYVLAWMLIEVVTLAISGIWGVVDGIAAVLASYRIFEIVVANVNLALFDGLRLRKKQNKVAIVERSLVLLILNYFELVLCFSILYRSVGVSLQTGGSALNPTRFESIYFSVITQATVGYGDFSPIGTARLASMFQVLIGVLFTLIILARLVTWLPQVSSVETSKEP